MSDSLTVRRFDRHEWRSYRDLRLRALAESPDAFGSTLELEAARPDAEWARRLEGAASSGSNLPLVAQRGDEPIGLAWGRVHEAEPDVARLYQVWVAPEHRGHGVGRLLLDAVIAWATESGARVLALDVTGGDTPAMRLYARAGFSVCGEPSPLRRGAPLMQQPMRLALSRSTLTPPA